MIRLFIGEDILNTEKKVVNMNEKFKSLEALLKEIGITIEEYELIRKGSRKRFLTPTKKSSTKFKLRVFYFT